MTNDSGRVDTGMKSIKRYKDGELLQEMYVEEEMSTIDIAEELDCAPNTVRKYLKENDIDIRNHSMAVKLGHGNHPNEIPFHTDKRGREIWSTAEFTFCVHRLIAVAEYGIEPVKGMHVHHKSGIPWDNRPGNLKLVTNSEHQREHLKVEDTDRLAIAEMYEDTDASSYTIADAVDHDICPGTVIQIHREFYE